MNTEQKQAIASAISTLLLADHMGDAHGAGAQLAKLLWGENGEKDYMDSVFSCKVTNEMRMRLSEFEPDIWKINEENR